MEYFNEEGDLMCPCMARTLSSCGSAYGCEMDDIINL